MDFINSKQDLINYFQKGCKTKDQQSIGVEHEKFLFDDNSNQRVNFENITKRLSGVSELILAIPSTVEGEATAFYIKDMLKDIDIKL